MKLSVGANQRNIFGFLFVLFLGFKRSYHIERGICICINIEKVVSQ